MRIADCEIRIPKSESDVFMLTSDFEGLPLSLLEAMERGCVPVVIDIRSGIPELVRVGKMSQQGRQRSLMVGNWFHCFARKRAEVTS